MSDILSQNIVPISEMANKRRGRVMKPEQKAFVATALDFLKLDGEDKALAVRFQTQKAAKNYQATLRSQAIALHGRKSLRTATTMQDDGTTTLLIARGENWGKK